MHGQNIVQEIEEFVKSHPTLAGILDACPYNCSRNFNALLTEKLFINKLLVCSKEFSEKQTELDNIINDRVQNNRIIFLNGFSGNGKTTFLHYFLNKNSSKFKRIYIDCSKITFHADENPIITSLKKYIKRPKGLKDKGDLKKLKKCFNFIEEKFNLLSDSFTKDISKKFAKREQEQSDKDLIYLLDEMSESDIFLLFFLALFLEYERGKICLICFDNLDVVEVDYLAESFKRKFINLMDNVSNISQVKYLFEKNIDFIKDFKILFSLRDANNAFINSHIRDSWAANLTTINFKLFLAGEFYEKIVNKRIKFIEELNFDYELYKNIENVKDICAIINKFSKDIFFKNSIVKLFNCDIRKILFALYNLTTKNENKEQLQFLLKNAVKENDWITLYGIKGGMLFWFLQYLYRENFLKDYVLNIRPYNKEDGYVSHTRLILTILINKSNYNTQNAHYTPSLPDYCNLYNLISSLNHDKLFDYDIILATIARLFLCHKYGWVHLITLHNKKISSQSDFEEEKQLLLDFDKLKSNTDSEEKLEIIHKLNRIRIKINPAGFAFVKHVLPHFEYYVIITDSIKKPLFTLVNAKNDYNKYEFSTQIDTVFKQVSTHARLIRKHYANKLKPLLKFTPDKYKTSDFIFKHTGKSKVAENRGLPHVIRIITSHIDYIDKFRLFLLYKKDINYKEKILINKLLVNKIESYVGLLSKDCEDTDNATYFVNRFNEKINQIKNSYYKNFKMEIKIESTKH